MRITKFQHNENIFCSFHSMLHVVGLIFSAQEALHMLNEVLVLVVCVCFFFLVHESQNFIYRRRHKCSTLWIYNEFCWLVWSPFFRFFLLLCNLFLLDSCSFWVVYPVLMHTRSIKEVMRTCLLNQLNYITYPQRKKEKKNRKNKNKLCQFQGTHAHLFGVFFFFL